MLGLKLRIEVVAKQDRGDDHDSQVAREHQHRHSAGDEPFVVQNQEQRAQQQLVDHRVKILPQHGPLMQEPGQSSHP